MSSIELDLDAIESLNRDLKRILDQVVSLRHSVSSNANSVSSAIADRRNIRSRLSRSVGDLQDLEYRLGKLHNFINDAVDVYSSTDRRLAIRASEFNNLMNQITINLKPMTGEPSRETSKAYLTRLAQAGGAASEWARDELAKLKKEDRKTHLTELVQAGGAAAEWTASIIMIILLVRNIVTI